MRALLGIVLVGLFLLPVAAFADADEQATTPQSLALGLQPLRGPIPEATPAPGESRSVPRADGSVQAVPDVHGKTKVFHIVERQAPWSLYKGLTVMARTYNGTVPGPVLQVNQGDTVVIDYRNDADKPDTIHLHGIHGAAVDMDGVPGISQPMVPPGGRYQYRFVANQPGTFIYHTHGTEAMLESGLYGAIVVLPSHPLPFERNIAHDYVEMISSWMIQSGTENHFTLNGKEYPDTTQLQVRSGERIRIRWISMSGEEWHTMHTHGHDQLIVERDAQPLPRPELQDTVPLGPAQRVDVIVTANAKPGTWLIHCHVADHVEGANSMPAGLITALHYEGTPNVFGRMESAMMPMMTSTGPQPLSMQETILLGAIAGFTIFLGLPIARARKLSMQVIALLNALAIGILVFLVVEIAQNATIPLTQAMTIWKAGQSGFPVWMVLLYIAGFMLGLVGLGSVSHEFLKRQRQAGENPWALSAVIALGIGAHNFGEGLAIGASASTGATALAIGLIIGFALHNATEGFGIAAPMAGRMIPSWGQIFLAGLIAGGPTFIGTVIGYYFTSPLLSVFFLTIAAGALVFVIGEMWSILKRTGGLTTAVTTALACGFFVALATEMLVDLSGG